MSQASASPDPIIGRTIAGKFVIESLIGGGAMGDVYLAKHVALDTHVALKVMHEELAKDPRFGERFQREAKAASKLNHTNSVRVIDFGQEPDGTIYIAMEYLRGRDLLKVLNDDWPIPPERAAAVMSQALGALAVAHDLGIIHRDLKPENIMVVPATDDEGNVIDHVKVCDFGIAKMSDSRSFTTEKGQPALTQTGTLIGTPEYMSPEQARGDTLDVRSDLYSMGVVLYQILCGDLPFKAENALGVVLKVVTDDPVRPSEKRQGVHPGLEAVCLKAMRKTRGERYQTAKEMRTALRDAIGLRSVATYPDSLSGPIGSKVPSSGGSLQHRSSAPEVERHHISNAPTIDVSSGNAAVAISATPSDSGESRPMSLSPKDTSAGTALAPQVVAPRSNFGIGIAAVVVVAALIGGAVVIAPRFKPKPVTVQSPASAATDLEPLEAEPSFASPLGSGSSASVAVTPPPGDPKVGARAHGPGNGGGGNGGGGGGNGGGGGAGHGGGHGNGSGNGGKQGAVQNTAPAISVTTPAVVAPALVEAAQTAAPTASSAPAPFNAQTAHVEIGFTNVTDVKAPAVRGVFGNVHQRLNGCYRDALAAAGQRIDGVATFSLSIDGTGLISGVAVTGIEHAPQVARCFQTAIFHKQIAATALEGPSATAEVWVTLRPN